MSAGTTARRPRPLPGTQCDLRYSINVTLDGCCDHLAIPADDELHRHAAESIASADAILFSRVTYDMMEGA